MEFADLIRISRVDNVRLRRGEAGVGAGATIAVTGHHLIISLDDDDRFVRGSYLLELGQILNID